jgi:hypothetical protein
MKNNNSPFGKFEIGDLVKANESCFIEEKGDVGIVVGLPSEWISLKKYKVYMQLFECELEFYDYEISPA